MSNRKIQLDEKKGFFENLKSRGASVFFGSLAFISGFFFLSSGVTGNTIAEGDAVFNFIPLIGLVLVVCALVLLFYAVTRR